MIKSKLFKQFCISFVLSFLALITLLQTGYLYRANSSFDFIRNLKLNIDYRIKNKIRHERSESMLYSNARNTSNDLTMKSFKDTPVLYFHYEPGIGFRYFFGGNIEYDYDFYSESVQIIARNSPNIYCFLKNLGYPNLLIYGVQEDLISYRRYSNTNYPHYFNSEFRKFLKGKSVVEFSSSDGLLLYKIDIDFLSSHKFELDQCKSTSLK